MDLAEKEEMAVGNFSLFFFFFLFSDHLSSKSFMISFFFSDGSGLERPKPNPCHGSHDSGWVSLRRCE